MIWYIFLQVIASEGEQKAAKALKEAADIIAQSPAALQLRYLQVTYSFGCQTLYEQRLGKIIVFFS